LISSLKVLYDSVFGLTLCAEMSIYRSWMSAWVGGV